MKISLNPARLGANGYSFTQFVDLAAQHGFDGVDFGVGGAMRLAEAEGGVEALKEYARSKNVASAVFGLDVEWRKDDEAFQSGLAKLPAQAAFAQALGSDRCTTWMPPSINDDLAVWTERTATRFREIAVVFADYGIRLGLEWVGPHHLRAGGANQMGANPGIFTLEGTLDLISQIGQPNVGLLVDCYHCFTTGIGEAEIAKLNDAQIVHVHVNDAAQGTTMETAKDGERVLPGEGVIDLPGFLRGLQAAGYQGYVAAEVLAPQDIAGSADESAAKVRASLKNVGL
ncbi:MAG: sugar phosphate isomerase/epimerase family protein [Armatimonadota bacterium]